MWGNGANGRLGYGNTTAIGDNENPRTPGDVDLGVRSAVDIAAGEAHTCALLDNGKVHCWGSGANGRLPLGVPPTLAITRRPAPFPLWILAKSTLWRFQLTSSMPTATLANGSVRLGTGANGHLGTGDTSDIGDDETPGSVAPAVLGRDAVQFRAEGPTAVLRSMTATLRCWGLATSGQLGYANTNTIGDDELQAARRSP